MLKNLLAACVALLIFGRAASGVERQRTGAQADEPMRVASEVPAARPQFISDRQTRDDIAPDTRREMLAIVLLMSLRSSIKAGRQ